jgi:hypothetical protein
MSLSRVKHTLQVLRCPDSVRSWPDRIDLNCTAQITTTRPGAPAGAPQRHSAVARETFRPRRPGQFDPPRCSRSEHPQGHSAVARETRADLPVIDNSLVNHYFLVFTISPSTTLGVSVGRSIGLRCATPPRPARLLAHQTPAPEISASVADRPEPADHALSSRSSISVSANTPFETSRRSAPARQDACRWCNATGLLPPRSA